MFQLGEPVEIFHQFGLFLFGQQQKESFGEFIGVVGYSLIDVPGGNTVNFCYIAIDKHFDTPDLQNSALEVLNAERALHVTGLGKWD